MLSGGVKNFGCCRAKVQFAFDIVMASDRRLTPGFRSKSGVGQFAAPRNSEPWTPCNIVPGNATLFQVIWCSASYAPKFENTVLPSGDSAYGNGCDSRRVVGASSDRHQPPPVRTDRPFAVAAIPHSAAYGCLFVPDSGGRDSLRVNLHDRRNKLSLREDYAPLGRLQSCSGNARAVRPESFWHKDSGRLLGARKMRHDALLTHCREAAGTFTQPV